MKSCSSNTKRIPSMVSFFIKIIILAYYICFYFFLPTISFIWPSIKTICPAGVIVFSQKFLLANESSFGFANQNAFVMIAFFIGYTIIFGKAFCSFICPFGTIQDLFALIGHTFKRTKNEKAPAKNSLNKIKVALKGIKYLFLLFVLFSAWFCGLYMINIKLFGIDIFQFVFPWLSLEYISNFTVMAEIALVSLISLILFSIVSIFNNRFFCKYLCPSGALYNIISKISLIREKRRGIHSVAFLNKTINSLVYLLCAVIVFFAGTIALRYFNVCTTEYKTQYMLSDYLETLNKNNDLYNYTRITQADFLANYGLDGKIKEDLPFKDLLFTIENLPFDQLVSLKYEHQLSPESVAETYKLASDTDLHSSWHTVMQNANAKAVLKSKFGDLFWLQGNQDIETAIKSNFPNSGIEISDELTYGEVIKLIENKINETYAGDESFKKLYVPCCLEQ